MDLVDASTHSTQQFDKSGAVSGYIKLIATSAGLPVTKFPTVSSLAVIPINDGSTADSLADALIAGQLSPRTRRAYASDLAELLGVLQAWDLALADITRDHLHAWRRWLAGEDVPGLKKKEKPCAPATVSRKVSVARQFFGEAFDRGMIPTNPAARLRGFAVSGDSKTLGLSRTQAKQILDAIDVGTLLGLRDRAMLSLMLRTGLRRMDILQATCGAIGETQGHRILLVKASKGNKDRTIKLPVEVWRELEAWRAAARKWRDEKHDGTTPLFCAIVKSGRKENAVYNTNHL